MRTNACRLLGPLVVACLAWASGCAPSPTEGKYFGKVAPPEGQSLRYISGSEPESLDPQLGTGQPEARIYIALYEGLTEYDPRTGEPIPALAERWDVASGNTEFTFHLRAGTRWSDATPLTAADVVYSLRRGLSPALASRNAYMAYEIEYAEAFNTGGAFVRDPSTGEFLTDPDNPTRRLVVPGGEEGAPLPAELSDRVQGKELVPVGPEDVGVEALDERTVRFRTIRPVPFFPGLVSHQFFRAVPRAAIERHGTAWTRPGNIVTSGAFVLDSWRPYDRIVVVRNPMYWDAASVALDRITFFAVEDITTMMNLYKAGQVDATYNHTVPAAWFDSIQHVRDFMNEPEDATEYYTVNVAVPPMDDVRVRKAFAMAVDLVALAHFRKTAKPAGGLVPQGIFEGYPNPPGAAFDPKGARELLADAGYRNERGEYDPSRFPIDEVNLLYNTSESNRQVAEFAQAQWKQHLGLTVALKNEEFRTFLTTRAERQYKGMARAGWIGDYLDPYSFLELLSIPGGNNGSGWTDPRFVELLREANRESDRVKRFELLAQAESLMLDAQPIIGLYTPATNWMKKPYVKGMYANPLTMHAWKFVSIEHDPSKWE